MDNKKKARNLLLYLGIPIMLIVIAAIFLSTRQSEPPKTSTLVQYFTDGKVDSYSINYGSGVVELKLKEGEKAIYDKVEPDRKAVANAVSKKEGREVVKGQLADIERFLDDIRETSNGKETTYNLIRASDNSLLIDLIPTIIVVVIFIGAWIFFMRRMGGGGLGGREMSFGKAKIKNTNDEKRKTTFEDVAGADEEKEELQEVVEFLKNCCLWDLPAPVKPCWRARSRAKRACRSSPSPVPIL